jgi:O-antigen/teichoic acid export membrane protein
MSITYVLGSIINFRYEMAILLPKNDLEALEVFVLGFIFNFFSSIVLFFILLIFKSQIYSYLDLSEELNYLYLLPISIFFFGFSSLLNNLAIRRKLFKSISTTNISRAITISSIQVVWGLIKSSVLGLVFGNIASYIISCIQYLKYLKLSKSSLKNISKSRLKTVMIRYEKFPLYDMPTVIFGVNSIYLIPIFLTLFFSKTISGHFFLTQRVLGTPIAMIAYSFSDTFKEKATLEYNLKGNCKELFISTLKKLSIISIPPAIIGFFIIQFVFNFCFGKEWELAGQFSKIMIPMFLLKFINAPLSLMIYIGEKQRVNMILQFVLLLIIVILFYISNSYTTIIILITLTYCVYYIIQILYSARIAKAI